MQNLNILLYTVREEIHESCDKLTYYFTVNNSPLAVTLFTPPTCIDRIASEYQALLQEASLYACTAYMMKGENGE
jgi:hypothetical protein